MTLSREQAQALAHLAHLLRPAWNAEGIMAVLQRVQDADPFEAALATLRAAGDPKVKTPGVIPGPGSHWNEADPKVPEVRARPAEPKPSEACAICGKRADEAHPADHTFVPLSRAKQHRTPPPGDLVRDAIHEANGPCCACGTLAIHCPNHSDEAKAAMA